MHHNGFWLSDLRPQGRPKRIISCVPSQTELLSSLQLEKEVVGITLFCVHPNVWFDNKRRIGGTKSLKIDEIRALQPDLILGNKEENQKDQLKELASFFPVFVTDVFDYHSALLSMKEIGDIVGKRLAALQLIEKINKEFSALKKNLHSKRVVYLIWNNPVMTVGGDTFISSMLNKVGFVNCFSDEKRYPEVTIQEIKDKEPDYLFLSSEPFPFQDKHKAQFVTVLPQKRIYIIDGEYFSWYGSRLLKFPNYIRQLNSVLKLA